MATIRDYKAWLDAENIETAEDMLQIYRPVKGGETGWTYSVVPVRGTSQNVIVKGGEDDLLLTPKSREAFVKYMDSLFELGVDGQYALDHAMQKDD